MEMLKRTFLSLKILKVSGRACPQNPLAARAFGAQNLPRLALKSGYGPENMSKISAAFHLKGRAHVETAFKVRTFAIRQLYNISIATI